MADAYKFKTPRGRKIDVKPKRDLEFHQEGDEQEIGLIQGKMPQSKLEWRVSKALDMLKFDYRYRLPIGGGTLFRGGLVLDFLVYTHPLPTPLPVFGDYWHGGTKDDVSYRLERIKMMMGKMVGEPKPIWENEARTIPDAYKNLKRKLR